VVDKVDSCSVGEAHFPSGREWSELGYGLLLDGAAVGALAAVHPNVLLAARIDPGSGARVVVNKVRPSLGRMPLFPSRRKFSSSCCGGSGGHHAHCAGRTSGGW
jgi:hypothetical protein